MYEKWYLINIAFVYLIGGCATVVICKFYEWLGQKLQGFYYEVPVTLFEYVIQVAIWPIILIQRTLALPYQLWMAWEEKTEL